jgi:hypothetical protein
LLCIAAIRWIHTAKVPVLAQNFTIGSKCRSVSARCFGIEAKDVCDLGGSVAPTIVVNWLGKLAWRFPTACGPAGSGRVGIRRMIEEEETQLKAQLERLRQEHRDLDAAIEALQTVPGSDILQVQRLKKRKLALRDRIGFIEDQLTPDIIA